MQNITELDIAQHRDIKIAANHGALSAVGRQVLATEAAEVAKMACQMPVFFSRDSQTMNWHLSSLAAFTIQQHLFSVQGQWQTSYMPLSLQAAPLHLLASQNDATKFTVGINIDSPAISDSGTPLYENEGPSVLFNSLSKVLEQQVHQAVNTHHFIEAIEQQQLFKSLELLIEKADGSQETLQGLFTIDEQKLRALPDNIIIDWHRQGFIMILDAMLMSIHQVNNLILKHNHLYPEAQIGKVKMAVGNLKTD